MQWTLDTLLSVRALLDADWWLKSDVAAHSRGSGRESSIQDRAARSAHVLGEVGISVVMASVTTMASALVLVRQVRPDNWGWLRAATVPALRSRPLALRYPFSVMSCNLQTSLLTALIDDR